MHTSKIFCISVCIPPAKIYLITDIIMQYEFLYFQYENFKNPYVTSYNAVLRSGSIPPERNPTSTRSPGFGTTAVNCRNSGTGGTCTVITRYGPRNGSDQGYMSSTVTKE